jgi:hypothetical protein
MLRTAKVSDVRRELGKFFSDAAHHDVVTAISRYDNEQAFLIGKNMLLALAETKSPAAEVEVVREEDGSYTLYCSELDLVANDMDYEQAVEQLLEHVRAYADLYFEQPAVYLKDERRRSHLPLLIRSMLVGNDGELRRLLGLPSQGGSRQG